jgi:predicted aspartyl protease
LSSVDEPWTTAFTLLAWIMLQTDTGNLPQEQRDRLHPDFLANEQAYIRMRDSLLAAYRGQWVAVQDGKVVAAGPDLMAVMDNAAASGGHPYVALVGSEDAVVLRVRHAVFAYDLSYRPFHVPRLTARFWNHAETRSQQHADVIPDTGADISVLPAGDCSAIDLFRSPYLTGMAGGVAATRIATVFYRAKVEIDGQRYSALIQPMPGGRERIVGRDVLNQQRVLFDRPAKQVVVDP